MKTLVLSLVVALVALVMVGSAGTAEAAASTQCADVTSGRPLLTTISVPASTAVSVAVDWTAKDGQGFAIQVSGSPAPSNWVVTGTPGHLVATFVAGPGDVRIEFSVQGNAKNVCMGVSY